MYVMTVDQRHSRRDVDRVDGLIADLAQHPLVRRFERTAGDEIQGVADDPSVVVDIALELVRDGHWSVGIGIGPVDEPLPETTRAGRGPAFEAARTAVTRAKNTPAGIAVDGVDEQAAADAEAIMTLLAMLVARRSREGHAAVAQVRQGLSQSEAADKLGISKQAVSQRLSAAGWQAEGPARALAARLLGEADEE
ncbi:helix-turn-helix domain-containing protein [Antrihabitans stalactiti]|uniref:Helix-turn-helix transcriptional regulator n=1 Tax=Antrihabitans stalactiti TaxID=2584121 RepID=A0A848K7W1_9NOCA|nr:helix-turn-helix domain-containing protein [Antrihabitans stalactiti]NMN93468.1 helix-turn-helix transcriptional regulator [Antrihabitans stalactiti]